IDSLAPSSYSVVRKMWSPQTIGEECPRPGTAVFHFTPSVGDHVSRYFPVLTIPWPDGPRQRDQYFAPSPSTSIIAAVSFATARTEGETANAPAAREIPARETTTADRIFMRNLLPQLRSGVNRVVTM